MPKAVPPARHGVATLAELASLALFAAPIQTAHAHRPLTPVTVLDDPGRIAYQSRVDSFCVSGDCEFYLSRSTRGT